MRRHACMHACMQAGIARGLVCRGVALFSGRHTGNGVGLRKTGAWPEDRVCDGGVRGHRWEGAMVGVKRERPETDGRLAQTVFLFFEATHSLSLKMATEIFNGLEKAVADPANADKIKKVSGTAQWTRWFCSSPRD